MVPFIKNIAPNYFFFYTEKKEKVVKQQTNVSLVYLTTMYGKTLKIGVQYVHSKRYHRIVLKCMSARATIDSTLGRYFLSSYSALKKNAVTGEPFCDAELQFTPYYIHLPSSKNLPKIGGKIQFIELKELLAGKDSLINSGVATSAFFKGLISAQDAFHASF